MKITFDQAMQDKLGQYGEVDFVLDIDHELTDGKSKMAMSCSGISRYRLIVVDKGVVPDIFDERIDSNLGTVYMKNYGKFYLDEELKIRIENNVFITLLSDGAIFSRNVELVDYRHLVFV
ncbi:MAG: hypothetical protein LBV67_10680 [Streptococcaceae bacterium]|jgi:uncharacterized protein YqkB|nr:hypothetical protein [Streptococcaceae bacterium]